jgi:hypothetical protein
MIPRTTIMPLVCCGGRLPAENHEPLLTGLLPHEPTARRAEVQHAGECDPWDDAVVARQLRRDERLIVAVPHRHPPVVGDRRQVVDEAARARQLRHLRSSNGRRRTPRSPAGGAASGTVVDVALPPLKNILRGFIVPLCAANDNHQPQFSVFGVPCLVTARALLSLERPATAQSGRYVRPTLPHASPWGAEHHKTLSILIGRATLYQNRTLLT